MCGIIGCYSPNGYLRSDGLREALNTMTHRGPDHGAEWQTSKAFFGHRRLSIFDLSEGGNQPMHSKDGRFTIVFNGEVYNFKELREKLHSPLKSDSDTEVVLAYWAKYGESCIPLFNGMFAFAVHDNRSEEIFLVRDRIGIKPLYYSKAEKSIDFASEIRPLIALQNKAKINRDSLGEYLLYGSVSAPNTIVEGIHMVKPGTFLKYSSNGLEEKKYWTPEPNEQSLKYVFNDAVDKRMLSDVPVGVFLSGGIDSSIVASVASKQRSHPIDTFSIGFDDKQYDESAIAQQVAKHIGSNHHLLQVNERDCFDSVVKGLEALDHPSLDGLNTFIVAGETKRAGMTVALSGLGGDELFAGYPAIFQRSKGLVNSIFAIDPVRYISAWMLSKSDSIKSQKLRSMLELDDFDLVQLADAARFQLMPRTVKKLLSTDQDSVHSVLKGRNFSAITMNELAHYLPNVLLRDSDQMGMAHSLEIRVPFLDHRVVEAALAMTDIEKARRKPKQILIDTFGSDLPSEVWKRKKMGFELPWANWLRSDLLPLVGEAREHLKLTDWFASEAVDEVFDAFYNGNEGNNWSRVWLLVVLSNWMRRYGVE